MNHVQGMGDSNYPWAELERNIIVCTVIWFRFREFSTHIL